MGCSHSWTARDQSHSLLVWTAHKPIAYLTFARTLQYKIWDGIRLGAQELVAAPWNANACEVELISSDAEM